MRRFDQQYGITPEFRATVDTILHNSLAQGYNNYPEVTARKGPHTQSVLTHLAELARSPIGERLTENPEHGLIPGIQHADWLMARGSPQGEALALQHAYEVANPNVPRWLRVGGSNRYVEIHGYDSAYPEVSMWVPNSFESQDNFRYIQDERPAAAFEADRDNERNTVFHPIGSDHSPEAFYVHPATRALNQTPVGVVGVPASGLTPQIVSHYFQDPLLEPEGPDRKTPHNYPGRFARGRDGHFIVFHKVKVPIENMDLTGDFEGQQRSKKYGPEAVNGPFKVMEPPLTLGRANHIHPNETASIGPHNTVIYDIGDFTPRIIPVRHEFPEPWLIGKPSATEPNPGPMRLDRLRGALARKSEKVWWGK